MNGGDGYGWSYEEFDEELGELRGRPLRASRAGAVLEPLLRRFATRAAEPDESLRPPTWCRFPEPTARRSSPADLDAARLPPAAPVYMWFEVRPEGGTLETTWDDARSYIRESCSTPLCDLYVFDATYEWVLVMTHDGILFIVGDTSLWPARS